MTTSAPNLQDARVLLDALFGDAPEGLFVEIRRLAEGQPATKTFLPTSQPWKLELSWDGRFNVYYGVCLRGRRGGKADDVALATCVWVDDAKLPLPQGFFQPSAIVETSPGKFQQLWVLREPTNDLAMVEGINHRLAHVLQADNVGDRARILRLPGYVNLKYPDRPRARIDSIDGVRYTLDQLDSALPQVVRGGTGEPGAPQELPSEVYSSLLQPQPAGGRVAAMVRLMGHFCALGETRITIYRILSMWNEKNLPPLEPEEFDYQFEHMYSRWGAPREEWESPIPFQSVPRPPFPVDALPGVLGQYVVHLSDSLQVPPDLGGCLVLGSLAIAASGRASVLLREDWSEPLNLYCAAVLDVGERKSAAAHRVVRPLEAREITLAAEAESHISEVQTNAEIMDRQIANAKQRAARAKNESERNDASAEARYLALERLQLKVPNFPRLLADDATPEAVASLLAEQNGKMGIMSTEGGIFDIIAGRYSDGVPNLDVYLKGHSGDTLRVDRKGRPPEHIDKPLLSIVITVQPWVISALGRKPILRGRGLLARFLYSVPYPKVGYRSINPSPMDTELEKEWHRIVTHILSLEDTKDGDPHLLYLSPEAHDLFQEFRGQVEVALRVDGDLGEITGWGSKLPGAVARIAGTLHLASHVENKLPWQTPISARTMTSAISLGHYFQAHALVAFGIMGADSRLESAEIAWQGIDRHKLTSFRERDLWQVVRRRLSVAALSQALETLEDLAYVRRRISGNNSGPGRPASPSWEVNPLALGKRTQNPQNPTLENNDTNSEDFEYVFSGTKSHSESRGTEITNAPIANRRNLRNLPGPASKTHARGPDPNAEGEERF